MSKTYSQTLFAALKKAGVKGLRSRRSARAIASLVGQEMTLSEIKSAMTDEKQVPLAKSHDWLFFEEDDSPIIALGKGRYEVRLHFRQFVDKVSPGEMVTATFTLGLKGKCIKFDGVRLFTQPSSFTTSLMRSQMNGYLIIL